jgi:hypothetical protein
MLKCSLNFLIALVTAGLAHSTTRFTSGNTTWSALAPITTDTVYIRAAHTVTIDVNNSARSCAALVDSGTVSWQSGKRLNIGAVRLVGTMTMTAGDTLHLYNEDLLGSDDFSIISAGRLTAFGTQSSPVVIKGNTANGVLPSIVVSGASARCYLRRFDCRGFQGNWPSAGVTFNSADAKNISLRHGHFDSASVAFRLTGGHCLVGCRFTTYGGMNRAITLQSSPGDSIIGCRIVHNAIGSGNFAGAQGIYVWSDNTYIYGCNIKDSNFTGAWGGDYGIALEQNVGGTRIIADTVSGFEFTVASPGGNHPNVRIQYCKIQSGAHESVILHNGDTNWKLYGNTITSFSSGGRSTVTVYCNQSGAADGLELLYNTIISNYGGAPASAALAFENTSVGTITYNNIKLVGNLLIGDNTGFSRAEMVLGTTATQNVTVNFTEFKDNAFDSVYYFGSSSATYPYNRLDSNLHNATSFIFVDSTGGDFRLGAGSPMKNAGDSAYGCLVYGDFRAATRPFNIGADQNFPSRWRYARYSTNGLADSAWIRVACLAYSGSDSTAFDFIGRKYDLCINGDRYIAAARAHDSMIKNIVYTTLTSYRSQDYADKLPAFRDRYYPSIPLDSFALKLNADPGNVLIQGQQSTCASVLTSVSPGEIIKFCGWTESNRWCPDFRLPIAQRYVRHKSLDGIGVISDGIMQDEASMYKAAYCCGNAQDEYGMLWPFQSGAWSPSGSFARTRGWEGKTYNQIRDSLIQLKRNVWGKALEDSLRLYNIQSFGNFTNYALPLTSEGDMSDPYGDARDFGAGHLTFENSLAPYVYGQTWNNWAWTAMDSIAVWDTAQMIVWTTIVPSESLSVASSGGWKRLQLERLVWYYMAAGRKTLFCLSSNTGGPNLLPNDYKVGDTLYKFIPAVARNVGYPLGPRYVAASGTDPAGQSYTLYRRDFSKAIMLYRQQSGTDYSSGSAVSYDLGQECTPIDADNQAGVSTSVALIRNMEGQIWWTTTVPQSPPISPSFKNWRRT